MDPFYTSTTPAPVTHSRPSKRISNGAPSSPVARPSERLKAEPQPQVPSVNGLKSASAGLRRSTGLFNLKLDVENPSKSENLDASDVSLNPRSVSQNSHLSSKIYGSTPMNASSALGGKSGLPMTPDASVSANISVPPTRQRASTISLKRPHPFSSGKPTKSGFLSRSSASHAEAASPAGQKRLHLTTADDDRSLYSGISSTPAGQRSYPAIMTPELSFRGAKPVQTAFTSTGLQSKKHVPSSPKPRVPETPCKRPMNDSLLGKDVSPGSHFSYHMPPSVLSQGHHQDSSSSALSGIMNGSGSFLSMKASPSLISHDETDVDRMGSPVSLVSASTAYDGGKTPSANHPVDRLQRFSIGHLNAEELEEVPETPTRFGVGSYGQHHHQEHGRINGLVHTSTPLARFSIGAGRRSSDTLPEVGALPQPVNNNIAGANTVIKPRPLPTVLQSVDPADSLSVSPPESLDLDGCIAASSSSLSDTSMGTNMSPRTPDIEESLNRQRQNSALRTVTPHYHTESQASPRPRRSIRFLGLRSDQYTSPHARKQDIGNEPPIPQSMLQNITSGNLRQQSPQQQQGPQGPQTLQSTNAAANSTAPPLGGGGLPQPPPMRVETPLGSMHMDPSPRTPVSHSYAHNLLNNETQTDSHDRVVLDSGVHQPGPMHDHQHPHDPLIAEKFDRVLKSAFGEFSAVFIVAQGKQRFAVKRTKRPMLGQPQRLRRREEVEILRTLAATNQDEEDPAIDAHIVQLISEWEAGNFGYIMTEYCENGDLSRFLADQGRISRLEEWRVWKILVEVLQGLAVIHQHDILHLDLKPANVFVTFEGHLKIGDFGMATRYPVPPGFEREGDREYIAPEVLERQQYGKEADIFSVGLMMVEVAANIVLPDNGIHWHRLRSGDLSDAGRLSSGDLTLAKHHSDLNNQPPAWAPRFLIDDKCLLDTVVYQMLHPQPEKRPTVQQLLNMPEIELVNLRGQAGAVIYEGEYGPEPEMADETSVWQRA